MKGCKGSIHPSALPIIGLGAVGRAFAFLASRHGQPYQFLDGRETVSKKVTFEVNWDNGELRKLSCLISPLSDASGDSPFCIVCTRANNLVEVLQSVESSRLARVPLIIASNGIELLPRLHHSAPLIRMLIHFGAATFDSISTRCFGNAKIVVAGEARDEGLVAKVTTALSKVGLLTTISPSIEAAEWEKAPTNLVVNLLATLADKPNGIVLEDPLLRDQALAILQEFRAVAITRGICVPDDLDVSVMKAIASVSKNINSTLVDVREQRPLELPFIVTPFLNAAEEAGIAVPTVRACFSRVIALGAGWG